MKRTINSIDSAIWEANKAGRNSISIPPFDFVPDYVVNNLKKNGFVCLNLETTSGMPFLFIQW